MAELDPRLHFVVVTGIVAKDGKMLIMKRAAHEKAFPDRWTVPGGKLVYTEYKDLPKTTPNFPQWYHMAEWVLRKEVKEEAGIEINEPKYLTDLVFVRPDGFPVLTLSYWCTWKSGDVVVGKDLVDHAWVTPEEAKKYDLIEGIAEEIEEVGKLLADKV